MTDLARRTVLAGLAAAPLSLSADGARAQDMRRYICTTPDCRPYIYNPAEGDPDSGIPPGTSFADIPDDWYCPVCGSTKTSFIPLG